MPTWPASLPQSPDAQGYQEGVAYPIVQAPVDGPPLSRRRYTSAPKTYKASFLLTKTELDSFEAFFAGDIAHGALAYTWKERGISTNPNAQFRITAAPQIAYVGGVYWRVSLDLLKLP